MDKKNIIAASIDRSGDDGKIRQPKLSGGGYSNDRIGYIDALKGFSILCVVLGHIADGYLKGHSFPASKNMLYCVYSIIYAFHMPLFMAISGYVYYTAYFDEKGMPRKVRIWRQILNLVAVYLIFSISFGLFKIACGRFVNTEVSFSDILMIWARPISPYWYLYALIILYIFFSIKQIQMINQWICIIALLCTALGSSFIRFGYFEISHVMYYSVFFYAGMLHRKNNIFGNKWLASLMFLLSVILIAAFWRNSYRTGIYIYQIPVVGFWVAGGIVLAIWFAFEHVVFLADNSLLKLCGRYSLEIYVIHCVFTAGFRSIFPKIGITDVYLCVFLNFIISTTVPILFSMLCRRLNIHGLLFKPVTYIMDLKKENRIG